MRHWVIDEFAPRSLVNAALVEWPSETWQHWHRYADNHATKFATKDVDRLPRACRMIFDRICELDVQRVTSLEGLFPDTNAYGAGMHWLPKGGRLGIHLDAATHPLTGWSRRLSASLYLTDETSGDLVLCDASGTEAERVEPQPGRLVLFETDATAFHGVPDVITAESGRKSIAAFFWSLTQPLNSRTAAEFI